MNGCQILRRVDDSDISYKALTVKYNQAEIDKIVCKEIIHQGKTVIINND